MGMNDSTPSPSIALRAIPQPDFADASIIAIPATATALPEDPRWWTEQVFSVQSAPGWIRALFALRQLLVGLIGIKRGKSSTFDVDSVEGHEALIVAREDHLDFAAGVAIDPTHRLLTVTTAVRFNNRRGRVYFIPVSLLHGPIVRSMAKRAVAQAISAPSPKVP